MGVAIIWSQEMEQMTQCSFNQFKDLYFIIEAKYSDGFPDHAKQENFPD